jgi:hypothetical protein
MELPLRVVERELLFEEEIGGDVDPFDLREGHQRAGVVDERVDSEFLVG